MSAIPDDIRAHNRELIRRFRATGGPPEGGPMLLLTTTGRRTGRQHTTPMMYVRIDDRLLVIASNAGALKNPDWFHNLVASPLVTVERAGETYQATAVVPAGAERDELFARIVAQYPFFRDHQAKVTRTIPIVELRRDRRNQSSHRSVVDGS